MKTLLAVSLLLLSTSIASAQSDAQKLLEKFRSMVGTWEGKTTKGDPVQDTYNLTAGGTAVMGENRIGHEEIGRAHV